MSGDSAAFYRREHLLGKGGFATTWQAVDTRTNQRCAYKELQLQQLGDWKDLELFERETQVLRHLDHPGIPRLLDAWHSTDPPAAVLVQAFVPGRNLQDWVDDGKRFREAEILAIGAQAAGILTYLHGFTNPVIHRDVKPSNLMLDIQGQVSLIDFGAVALNSAQQGQTVTGTFGYMPLEQIEGHAVPASDLYGLGATLVFLLTGRVPTELPKKGLKPDFRAVAQVSPAFARLLDRLLEPEVGKRLASAAQLQAELQRLLRPQSAAPMGRLRGWGRVVAWKRLLPLGAVLVLLLGLGQALLRQTRQPPMFRLERRVAIAPHSASWQPAALAGWERLEPAPRLTQLLSVGEDVWGLSARELYHFTRGRIESWAFQDLTGSYSSMVALAVPRADETWFASFDGRLYQRQQQQTREISLPQKLTALTSFDGEAVIATGFKVQRWHNGRFESLGEPPVVRDKNGPDKLSRLFVARGTLLAAADSQLFRYHAGGWEAVFSGKSYDARIHSLAADATHLWLGLEKGLLEIDTVHGTQASLLSEGPVSDLAFGDRQLWLTTTATTSQGLGRFDTRSAKPARLGWREGLPEDRFAALALADGRLWLSARSGELWRAPLSAVNQAFQRPPAAAVSGLRFENACQAFAGLHPAATSELAGLRAGGDLRVYFHRQQVCPYGQGYRRDDGTVVLSDYTGLRRWRDGQLRPIEGLETSGSIGSLLLAANDDLWLAPIFPYQARRLRQGQISQPPDFSGASAPHFYELRDGRLLAAAKLDRRLPLQLFRDGRWEPTALTASDAVSPHDLLELTQGPRAGQLALATDKGLYLIDANLGDARQVADLPYDDVAAVAQDARGRLWIVYNHYGAGRGLSLWEPGKGKPRHLDARGGLWPDRFQNLAFDAAGRLWLQQADNRVSIYKPETLEGLMK